MVDLAQDPRSELWLGFAIEGKNTHFHRANTGAFGTGSSGDGSFTITGFGSVSVAILRGHTVTVDGNTYTLTADASVNGSGAATFVITPVLATTPSAGDEVVVSKNKTFYWSEVAFSTKDTDTPADEIFEPFASLPKHFASTLAKGDSIGQGFDLDEGEVVVRARELLGNEKYIAKLEPYEFDGQPASAYLLGKRSDEVLNWSTKKTLLDGTVGNGSKWTESELRIPLRAKGSTLTNSWHRYFKGFGECPFFPTNPGTKATAVVDAALWDPSGDSFTLLALVFPPEGSQYDTEEEVFYKGSDIRARLISSGFEFQVKTATPATHVVTTVGSSLDFGEPRFYALACVCDRTLDQIRIYVDGVLYDTAEIGSDPINSTAASDLAFMSQTSASGITVGMIAEISLHDRAIPQSEIATLQGAPLVSPGTKANLLAYWPGLMDATPTKMFDIGPTYDPADSPTSAWHATLSASVLKGHTMEGNADGRGMMVPKAVGFSRNSSPFPQDPTRNIFMYHDGPCQVPTAVYNRGVEMTIEADYDLETFYETTPSTGDDVTFCSAYGLMRIGALTTSSQITLDFLGRCSFSQGYQLVRANSEYKVWSAVTSEFDSAFTLMFWWVFADETHNQFVFDYIDAGGGPAGFQIAYQHGASNPNALVFTVYGDAGTGNSASVQMSEVYANEPHHYALVVAETAGDLVVTLLVDGIQVDTDTVVGEGMSNGTVPLTFGRSAVAAGNYAGGILSELMIHSAAESQATIRDLMYRTTLREDIVAAGGAPSYAPNLAHYYGYNPRSDQHATGELDDQVGSELTNSGTDGRWAGGVAMGSTLHHMYDLLQLGGVDHDDIDTTDAYEPSLCRYPIGWQPESAMTIPEMIAAVKVGAAAQAIFAPETGKWYIRRTEDPADLTAVATIDQDEDMSGPLRFGEREIPPRSIQVRWGMNGTVQQTGDLATTTDGAHRLFVSLPHRYAQEIDSPNADLFASRDVVITVEGIWVREDHAVEEAVRQMEYRGRKIPIPRYFEVPLTRSRVGVPAIRVGEALTIVHEDIPEGSRDALLVMISTDGKTAKLRCWG